MNASFTKHKFIGQTKPMVPAKSHALISFDILRRTFSKFNVVILQVVIPWEVKVKVFTSIAKGLVYLYSLDAGNSYITLL